MNLYDNMVIHTVVHQDKWRKTHPSKDDVEVMIVMEKVMGTGMEIKNIDTSLYK